MAEKSIDMRILTTSGNTYTFEFGMVGVPQNKKRNCNKISRLNSTKPIHSKKNGSIFKS
jgi:hypothetical protein